MSKINDSGSAFPVYAPATDMNSEVFKPGMTLRQWYAGQALAGTLADPEIVESKAVIVEFC